MEFQRLKDKLGTRSLPAPRSSSGAPVRGCSARRAAACRRSSAWSTTRGWIACSARSACTGAGTLEAIHHARHRRAFGSRLIEQPAMHNVLADLALDSEAATAAAMRVARAYDEGEDGTRVPPLRDRRHEVLDLQARAGARRRGARVPGRQRLCRGLRLPGRLPRRADQLDLGGLGQRRGARRAARARRESRRDCAAFLAECELRAGLRPSPRCAPRPHRRPRRRRSDRVRRTPDGEDLALALQGSLLVRHAPPRSPTSSALLGSAGGRRAPTGRCRPASMRWRSSTASPPRT